MSRDIDPENLSSEDLLYIAHRPSLRQEFILQGYPDPLENFDFSVLNPNEEETYGIVVQSDPSEGEGEEGLPEWTEQNTKAELLALINGRNADREDDDKIVIEGIDDLETLSPADVKKDVLTGALAADDEAHAEA